MYRVNTKSLAVSTLQIALAGLVLATFGAPAQAQVPVQNEAPGFDEARAGEYLDAEAFAPNDEILVIDKDNVEKLPDQYLDSDPVFTKFINVRKLPTPYLPNGIDHRAAGTGLRNAGYGTIRLRGIPNGAQKVSAFVYLGVIMANPPNTLTFNFNGTAVTAIRIGTAAQPCWNGAGTFAAYRASVLNLIPNGIINGDYLVSAVPSNVTDGSDPWKSVNNTLPLAEGASLVVLYSHSSVPRSSWVQIHHVVQMTAGSLNTQHFLNRPLSTNSALVHTRLGADGQSGFGLQQFSVAANNETTVLGDFSGGGLSCQIKGTGSPINADSDWNGYDGEPLNQLWDTHTVEFSGCLSVGATDYQVTYSLSGDCVVPVAHVITAR